ncbi:MAG TPA: chemotaxis protein CheW [Pirellulaceae bacterium]|jgi:purine-binding chemotaxis protein CheW|nr:chemotaxis protein CheW [Pirellulaceae bacterium]
MSRSHEETCTPFDWEDAKRRLSQLAETLDPARHDSVERAQQILDERARELAVPLAPDADETDSIEILTFRMGGELYALETTFILELTRVATLTKVPDCPAFVRGITNLRGEVLAIVDLCTLFQVADPPHDKPWILVLGDDRAEFGIVIDDAVDVCSINTCEIFATPVSMSGVQHNLLRGVTEEAMLVLDGAALLADQRLMIDET